MRKNLTDRFVRFVRPTERQTDYWDTTLTGFGLRVSPGGKKVFEIYYRRNRQQRRMAVGPFPVLSLADARRLAKNLLADVAKGSDPATIKRADRHAETFAELSKSCLDELKRQNRSWQEAERIINVELLPAWKTRNANQITRKEIRALGQRIVDRGSGVMANRTLSVIHRIFRHGVENEWCQQNPCHGIKKLTVEHSRERELDADEIRAVWNAIEHQPLREAAILRLQLLTGQRIGEIRQMRVEDVDFETAWWTIPGIFTKNKKPHRVPLSPAAVNILQGWLSNAKAVWVFASPDRKSQAISYANIYFVIQRVIESSGVKNWGSHDLRRTVATQLTRNKLATRLTVHRILNHVDTDITAVYERNEYDDKKRLALDAWARRLNVIIENKETGARVLPMAVSHK